VLGDQHMLLIINPHITTGHCLKHRMDDARNIVQVALISTSHSLQQQSQLHDHVSVIAACV